MKDEGGSGRSLAWFLLPPSSFILLEQNVRRLQIPVDDAALVGVVHGTGERLYQLCRVGAGPRCAVEPGRQAAAVHELQGKERTPIGFPDLMDLHVVRVLQP